MSIAVPSTAGNLANVPDSQAAAHPSSRSPTHVVSEPIIQEHQLPQGREDVEVRLFGGPVLLHQGEEVDLTALESALLGLIWTVGRSGMSRGRAARLLWGSDERRTRRNLSQVLYRLKRDAPVPPIAADMRDLRPAEDLSSDLQRLRLFEVTAPVFGKPLEKLQLPGPCSELEQWLSAERARLRHVALDRNNQLLRAAEGDHDYALAIATAEGVLFYDPVNERALRSLIRATALEAGAAAADLAYRKHSPVFREVISDWRPSRETRRLLAELDTLKAKQAAGKTRHEIQHSVRLIGRKEELNQLREWCLGDTVSWRDAIVLGESGIGKSRLLEELSRQLAFDDCRVVQIRNWPGEERIAFNFLTEVARAEPFREAIISLPPIQRKVLARSLALEHLDVEDFDLPEIEDEAASRRLYEAARALFDALEGRVILLVDGLAAADASSLGALSFIRRRTRQATVRLVGTVNREGLKGSDTQDEYLRRLVDQIGNRVNLAPLSREESIALARAAASGELPPGQAERIADLGGGNPLFLVELAQPGAVEKDGFEAHVPNSLDTLFSSRVHRLSGEARTILNILSAQSRPVRLNVLSSICEFSRGTFLTALNETTRCRLLAFDAERVAFRHNVIRQWIYSQLRAAERLYIHDAILSHLRREDAPAPDLMAFHCHRAGRSEEAFLWADRAARAARARAAIPALVKMLHIALANAPSPAARFGLTAELGQTYAAIGRPRLAVGILNEAERLVPFANSWSTVAQSRVTRLLAEAETRAISDVEAIEGLDHVRATARDSGAHAIYFAASDATVLLCQGCLNQSRAADVLRSVRDYRVAPDSYEAALKNLTLTFELSFGSPTVAQEAAEEALRIVDGHGHSGLLAKAISRYIAVQSRLGEIDDSKAAALAERLQLPGEADLERRALVNAWSNLAAWYIDTLRPAVAKTALDKAEALTTFVRESEVRMAYESNLAEYFYILGERERAYEIFAAIGERGVPTREEVSDAIQAGAGLCALELGRLPEAKERFSRLSPLHEIMVRHSSDPTLVAQFAVRLLNVQGRLQEGLELLADWRAAITDRHIPAYLRLTVFELRLRRRKGLMSGLKHVEYALELVKQRGHLAAFRQPLRILLED